VGAAPSVGAWDDRAASAPDPAGTSDLELRAWLATSAALVRTLQLSARAPWVVTRKTAEGLEDVGTGPGDAAVSVRWEPLPQVALIAGVGVPLGRSHGRGLLGADVTGRGAFTVSFAASVEQVRLPWYVQAGIGATVPLPDGARLYGPSLDVSAAVGRELSDGVALHLLARLTLEGARTDAGVVVPTSDARELVVGPALSWKVHPRWTIEGAVETGVFASGIADNRPGRVGIFTAIRYGHVTGE
jgi:hypothetical protein